MRIREQMPELHGVAAWWLNSKPIKRSDIMGSRPALIHFWSISCGLCKDTMPKINELRDEYKDQLHVIAVHMPRSANDLDLHAVQRAADEHGMTQPVYADNQHVLTDAFHNQHVPAYYLFDADGKLRHFQAGGGGMITLRRRLNRVLGRKPI
jgi:thiol-disulfide isomerase/thioredoxin